jgi:AraC-like DNA-binding protein
MIESNNESAQETPVKSAYTINNIEQYIMDNLDDLTVEKLREDSGYTKNVFYKIFSQHYDISPKQLIDSIKEDKTRKRYSNRKSNPR